MVRAGKVVLTAFVLMAGCSIASAQEGSIGAGKVELGGFPGGGGTAKEKAAVLTRMTSHLDSMVTSGHMTGMDMDDMTGTMMSGSGTGMMSGAGGGMMGG